MVNSDIASSAVSNVVQGDAAIAAELFPRVCQFVTFSNIKDLNINRSIAIMTWMDLSVGCGSGVANVSY